MWRPVSRVGPVRGFVGKRRMDAPASEVPLDGLAALAELHEIEGQQAGPSVEGVTHRGRLSTLLPGPMQFLEAGGEPEEMAIRQWRHHAPHGHS